MSALTMFRGDTLVRSLFVEPSPTDVTGWTFWFTAKRNVQDPDSGAVYQAKTGDGSGDVAIVDAPNGKVTFRLPSAKTLGFPDGPVALVYDVQGKDGSGIVRTVESGTITVVPDVTRATT